MRYKVTMEVETAESDASVILEVSQEVASEFASYGESVGSPMSVDDGDVSVSHLETAELEPLPENPSLELCEPAIDAERAARGLPIGNGGRIDALADVISELANIDDATKMALFACDLFADAPRFSAARFVRSCGLSPDDSRFRLAEEKRALKTVFGALAPPEPLSRLIAHTPEEKEALERAAEHDEPVSRAHLESDSHAEMWESERDID